MKPIYFLPACLVLLFPFGLCAQTEQEKLHVFMAEVQAALPASPDRKIQRWGGADETRYAVTQIRTALASNNLAEAQQGLTSLSVLLDSEPLRKKCEELLKELRAEREAEDQKTSQEIETILQIAAKAVRDAKVPADLDAVISQLGPYGDLRGERQMTPALSRAFRRASDALRFVTQWQDYLAAVESPGPRDKLEILRGLLSDTQTDFIPRSEILARMHRSAVEPAEESPKPAPTPSDERVTNLLGKIRSLADLRSGLDVLDKISRDETDRLSIQAATVVGALLGIDQNYREFQLGQPVNINVSDLSVPSVVNRFRADRSDYYTSPSAALLREIQDVAIALRTELLKLSLPRYLDLPETQKSIPGETAISFLERVKAEALSKEDYLLLARAESTRSLLRTGTGYGNDNSQAALFITASRQDTAGQYTLAVTSYERALAATGDVIPARVIGQRLEAIKTQHPQEFQLGLEAYLAPPNPMRGYPMYGPGMMPGGRPAPMPTPALQVPAASPSPSK